MRESRVIALAGVMQACRLVHEVATTGRTDQAAAESSLCHDEASVTIRLVSTEGGGSLFVPVHPK